MNEVIAAALQFEKLVIALLISLPRVYAFIAMAGILNASSVPRLARNVAILVLTLPLIPLNLPYSSVIGTSLTSLSFYFAKEYAIGFIFGYMIGWIFWVVAAAGDLIDNQRGAAIAASIDPLQGHETSPIGKLFSQGFVTYFFSIGGMLIILEILYKSFALWPVDSMLPIVSSRFPELVLDILDHGMRTMFVLAGPVVALMFLSEFALALVSRFAPQIQVFVLAMPIKSAIAIFVLIFYIKVLFPFAADQRSFFPEFVGRLYSVLEQGQNLLSNPDRREGDVP
ncbi:type III secretion system export apparatus subunit SctT [Labrenzia sp. OB1]|uniref:type III secretion system export apparatus subunit SctT n=1 Tax=Labrenzia sp. OB1 TaxID=1561204 RepID=UPI0008383584|nr:type III secretion system export apparatus subunit SctT [Labrenzia sp. OB1]